MSYERAVAANLLLRAVRRRRGLSQRELAVIARVPRSTIERIEAGTTSPKHETLGRILESVGFAFEVFDDERANPITPDYELESICDGQLRRLPAHLRSRAIRSEFDPWWGWGRIAWSMTSPNVPPVTYFHRPRGWEELEAAKRRWLDAT